MEKLGTANKMGGGKLTLAELKTGDMAEILGYPMMNAHYRAKVLALGLTRGAQIKVVGVAPLGDPFEIAVRGYHLSLRRDEAGSVKVKKLGRGEVK